MCFDHFVDINGFDKGNNIPGFKEEYKNVDGGGRISSVGDILNLKRLILISNVGMFNLEDQCLIP